LIQLLIGKLVVSARLTNPRFGVIPRSGASLWEALISLGKRFGSAKGNTQVVAASRVVPDYSRSTNCKIAKREAPQGKLARREQLARLAINFVVRLNRRCMRKMLPSFFAPVGAGQKKTQSMMGFGAVGLGFEDGA